MRSACHSRRHFLGDLSLLALPPALARFSSNAAWANEFNQLASGSEEGQRQRVATSDRGVVATVHPLATEAGIDAMRRGGNAIDAAVAASLMLSVVDGHNSGIGGGCLAMIRKADGTSLSLDGREMAPSAASPEMFYRNGQPDPQLSRVGPLAAGVPGLLAALNELQREHGQISWNTALDQAAERAEQGFELTEDYARRLRSVAETLKNYESSARILLDDNGQPWPAGHRLRQSDLARTLQQVSSQGVDWFYQGEFAERCARYLQAEGGLMTAEDLAKYKSVNRPPVRTGYRSHTVLGFPPPSSGGIHIAQMLEMLSTYDLKEIFSRSEATGYHLLLEVMKRAMADRVHWLGDADYADVPRGLLDPDYLHERGRSIRLDRATEVESHGQPPSPKEDLFGRGQHTTHLTAADAEGNVVAITQTVNTSFGCKMIVPGTGVVLNNELDDFTIAPGVRNVFGLLGSEANLIAPGKRPLSSMSPTITLDADGRPAVSCGAAGGPKIITAALQILIRTLDLGETLEQAISAPRIHHQWSPDKAVCEEALAASVVEKLVEMGHNVERVRSAAVAQGCGFDHSTTPTTLSAASDPRVPSSARGL